MTWGLMCEEKVTEPKTCTSKPCPFPLKIVAPTGVGTTSTRLLRSEVIWCEGLESLNQFGDC